jgi:integration host factor subunit beta
MVYAGMQQRLLPGDRIEIRGFGALFVKQAHARPAARNPRTGETVRVPAGRKVQSEPGQGLRERPNRALLKG